MASEAWYVAAHQPGLGQYAVAQLARNNFESYWPMAGNEPLFVGYLFVYFSKADGLWGRINRLPGISYLLPFHSLDPKPLDPDFVPRLKEHLAMPVALPDSRPEPHPILAGDYVRVVVGPLSGHQARVLRIKGQTLIVAMKLFGTEIEARALRDHCEFVAGPGWPMEQGKQQ